VGKLVALCESRSCRLADLSPDDFTAANPAIGPDVAKWLGVANAVAAFRSKGSTAPAEVHKQLGIWRERLEAAQASGTPDSPAARARAGTMPTRRV
jgi:argininosuccinate lyase